GRSRAELPVAGLALALAIGTKLTALFATPVLLLLALVLLRNRQRAQFAAASAIAFVAVAAPVYAMNLRDYGTPLGPRSVRSDFEALSHLERWRERSDESFIVSSTFPARSTDHLQCQSSSTHRHTCRSR